ncbi:MAG TPA: hypothetical protein VKV22_04755 [Rhodanobacteraceae bacterium]|nr:hypothetical protein [Rhodanobacteraceae bacterium]
MDRLQRTRLWIALESYAVATSLHLAPHLLAEMRNTQSFSLRRRVSPNAIWVAIACAIDLFLLSAMLRQHHFYWNVFGAIVLLAAWALLIVWLNFRYTISWSGSAIVQTAFGLGEISIAATNITAIKSETSNTRTLIMANRPYRRISVYGDGKFIDISLKHFKFEDIRKLIAIVRDARPDLSMSELPKAYT